MLSNIGRAALRRVGGSTQSTNKALSNAWFNRSITSTPNLNLLSSHLRVALCRAYATTTEAKAKKVASKPPTVKKTSTKPKSKTKAKPKTKPKIKKTAKKPVKKKPVKKKKAVAKKAPKKPLTAEEKLKKEIILLKQKALLDAPKARNLSAWNIFYSEEATGISREKPLGEMAHAIGVKFKTITPAQLEVRMVDLLEAI